MRSGSVVRRRQLGGVLRDLREKAGFSVEVAAPRLDWSSSKLSRIENGQQGIDVHGVRSMLDLYDASDRWDELIELTRQTRQKGWWRAYGLDDKGYVPLEAAAAGVRETTIAYLPGLLQTAGYARAMFASALRPRTEAFIENAVAIRMVRQERLTTGSLDLVAVIDEAVLHRPVGGGEVMRTQFAHLIEAGELPSVTLLVLPTSLGARPGMSSFTLLSFGDVAVPDMAYVEHPMGAVHADKAEDVAVATLTFDRLRLLALDPAESLLLIRRVADQQ